MNKWEEIAAWACWYYGKMMKHTILRWLYELGRDILDLEMLLYRHTRRVRRHWDTYMFKKERGGL